MKKVPEWRIEIIRSRRRKKTVSASLKDDVLQVRAPATMPAAELQEVVEKLEERLRRKWTRRKQGVSDANLEELANKLNRTYFDNELKWKSIRFVTNQRRRYGSCTPSQGTIRISHRLASMPVWVLHYVVVHELAHLVEPNHGRAFWALVYRYPLTERARGYLMAAGMEEVTEAE